MKYEFKKYVNSFTAGWLVITVLSVVAIIVPVVLFAADEEEAAVPFLALGILGLLLLIIGLLQLFSSRRLFKKIENEGKTEQMETEFQKAVPMAEGKLRMGSQHIFIKGGGRIPEYAEIRKIYQYVHRTNYVEDRRELRYENPAGKVTTLCKLRTRGKSDKDAIEIVAFIKEKKPDLMIGY